ncbi:hypothetical protein [Lonepinella sp. BR2271]|uniref:hypothetical protein n=1 Tax=Lonepinella sp. BR2271 TaxID=3434550 RepID=UPI003F6DFDEE
MDAIITIIGIILGLGFFVIIIEFICKLIKRFLKLFGFFCEICPKCNAKDSFKLDSTKIIDRYNTSKKVDERTATGKRRERHIKCTKVVKKYVYCCRSCNYKYYIERTEELT